ncbi:E3 ubiquitin-protein ligase MARCHF4-like [Erpetoichthys calabaricus]|uniref:RING-type E3 ubiquitin transferase n=1 Tax=Erpetoichthys calabaricus TaxID=27687 RepID=A0A8C4S552_ERPCA|nr:E3 ubiquitin-protein ligase MARCHF4-like [Erpetoichthys calabaricus]
MLVAAGIILWCCGILSHGQMLRHQGLLKSRCCVLFSDLKVFLLRPPAPSTPPPHFIPMSGGDPHNQCSTVSSASSAHDNNNTLISYPQRAAWVSPTVGGAAREEVEVWVGPAAELSASLVSSFSSDDLNKTKTEDHFSLSSSSESGIRTPLCRICFQGAEQGELLSPCRCSGSVRCTHQPCLIKWISERGSWSCELCYYKYHVIAISTKNPLQWQTISLTVIEKVQIAAAILGSLFLLASISWLIWSSLSPSAKWQRQDLLFQICYGMYGFMDVVCIGLIFHEGPSVYRIFKRWQAVNQQWKVLNYDKMKDSEDQKMVASPRHVEQQTQSISQAGVPSSTSSSLAAAAATTTSATPDSLEITAATVLPLGSTSSTGPSLMDNHCTYSILHLLSHLRQQEPRGQAGNSNRELVMRVTTV